MRKARSRRGRAAFPKVGVAVMVELGLHNPLAAALGAEGESEMVQAKRVLSAQPEQSLDCWTGAGTRRPSCWPCMVGAGSRRCFTRS